MLDAVPGLYLNQDTGDDNLNGFSPAHFIELLKDVIRRVHLSDNYLDDNLHFPVSCRSTDWKRDLWLLETLYDGTITLESFPSDKDYILQARDKVRKAWESVM